MAAFPSCTWADEGPFVREVGNDTARPGRGVTSIGPRKAIGGATAQSFTSFYCSNVI